MTPPPATRAPSLRGLREGEEFLIQEHHRRLNLDQELFVGEARHADPGRAWRIVAELRAQRSADRLALAHVALPDVEAQCAHLIERRADLGQRRAKVVEALLELSADVIRSDDTLVSIPGDLTRYMHSAAGRSLHDSHLGE